MAKDSKKDKKVKKGGRTGKGERLPMDLVKEANSMQFSGPTLRLSENGDVTVRFLFEFDDTNDEGFQKGWDALYEWWGDENERYLTRDKALAIESAPNGKPSIVMFGAVLNCDTGQAEVLEIKQSAFNQLTKEIMEHETNGKVTTCNMKYVRSGSGLQTKYKFYARKKKPMDQEMKKAKKKMVDKAYEVAELLLDQANDPEPF